MSKTERQAQKLALEGGLKAVTTLKAGSVQYEAIHYYPER